MYLIGMGSETALDVVHIRHIAREAVEDRVVALDAERANVAGDGGYIRRHSVAPMAAAGLPARRNRRDALTPPEQTQPHFAAVITFDHRSLPTFCSRSAYSGAATFLNAATSILLNLRSGFFFCISACRL